MKNFRTKILSHMRYPQSLAGFKILNLGSQKVGVRSTACSDEECVVYLGYLLLM